MQFNKKVLAHGHREEPADLETYLKRGYIDVGSELLGPIDLTHLEGSLRSCARREGRFLRAFRTQKGSVTFCCAVGTACPFKLQFQVPGTPSPGVEWRCTRLCATHSCRAADTRLLIIMDRQMKFFPVIKLGTPPEALPAAAPQAAAAAANRHVRFIKGEQDEDEPEPVEEEELAADPAAHRATMSVDMDEDNGGELNGGGELEVQQVRLQEEEHEDLNQEYLRSGLNDGHVAHKVKLASLRCRSTEGPSSRERRHDRDEGQPQESQEGREIARNPPDVRRSHVPEPAFSHGLKPEPDRRSSFKRSTEATQDSDPARSTKKVAIISAKKVLMIPRSQTKQACGAVNTIDSTKGAVATTLPTPSVFDTSGSCPRAAFALGVTDPNKRSAVAAKPFYKASTARLPVVASGSTSAKVPASSVRAQVAQIPPSKPTIKCLLPSTADQSRSKSLAVEAPVRRPTVRFARTEVFSTADGRSTTVSAKGDFLGVWVP